MRFQNNVKVGLGLVLLLFLVACTGNRQQAEINYLDASAPIEGRVEDLLSKMSLQEKIGQMTLVEKGSIVEQDITDKYIGALLSGGGGSPQINEPENWLEMVNGYQAYTQETPLKIPLLYGTDAVHGHNNLKGAVLFPHNIGLGATRNPELLREIGRVTALETAATGIFWNYAPALSVPQDIRWGRTYEGYSENTELVTLLSQAYLEGLQGDDLTAPNTIVGTPKHFVGDGGTAWGTSKTRNYQIDQGDTQIDEETLRDVHLPPYEAVIEAGARSIMVSYSSWNGTKLHAHDYLINDVLKGEMGFDGFVVSDWEAIDQINLDYYQAVVTAINAGVDMNMVPYNYDSFITQLTKAVENGDVSEERIDDAVRRILRVKFEMGLFERPFGDESLLAEIGSDDHRELAQQAVRESLVLLDNDGETLPLSKEMPLILVGGRSANNIGNQSGGWSISWQGATGNITTGTTILKGIRGAVSPETEVKLDQFGRFADLVDEEGNPLIAEVGIVIVGEQPYAEGSGDSNQLTISTSEQNIIAEMRARSEKLIVILVSGRPLIITDLMETADVVIAAWLPGTEGQGVADVLFGEYEFTGRLPYSWPRSMDQLPFDFTNLPEDGCDAPLFPFDYGLTTNDVTPALPNCG